jgi:hypothetical protein
LSNYFCRERFLKIETLRKLTEAAEGAAKRGERFFFHKKVQPITQILCILREKLAEFDW